MERQDHRCSRGLPEVEVLDEVTRQGVVLSDIRPRVRSGVGSWIEPPAGAHVRGWVEGWMLGHVRVSDYPGHRRKRAAHGGAVEAVQRLDVARLAVLADGRERGQRVPDSWRLRRQLPVAADHILILLAV